MSDELIPITRTETFLAKAGGQSVETPTPITREETFLQAIIDNGSGGGGGGGGALIVNVDPSTGAIDKTAKELYDAMDTQIAYFKASATPAEGVLMDYYALVEQRVLINGTLYSFTYADMTGNFPYSGIENAPCSANDYPVLSPA